MSVFKYIKIILLVVLYECEMWFVSLNEQCEYERVGAQGDPCTATIFWSVVRPHILLYSASSTVPLTKYGILHSRISSQSLGSVFT
jgi:hypothetical protein